MKTRILAAAVGLPLLLLVMLVAPLWAFAILVGAIAALAAYEFLKSSVPGIEMRTLIVSMALACVIPISYLFKRSWLISFSALFLLFFYLCVELIISLQREKPLKLFTVALVLMGAGVMPILIGALVRIGVGRESYKAFILLPFVISFINDSGAYFVGVFLGKHKLIDKVSPNKTIEGSAGGIVCTALFTLLYGLILKFMGYTVNFPVLTIYALLASIAGQIGDLSFSAVKRVCGVKDFGNLIPGHGGALDRFDSMFFVAPVVEILLLWVPAIII